MDGHAFDKKHRFAINRFTDIEKLSNLEEQYREPAENPHEEKVSFRVLSLGLGLTFELWNRALEKRVKLT